MRFTSYIVLVFFVIYAALVAVGFLVQGFSKELTLWLGAGGGLLLIWWVLMKTGILPETITKHCPKCGNELRQTAKFCGNCGTNA